MTATHSPNVKAIQKRAHGHWTQILQALGVREDILRKKAQPCPLCGGTDRFQFTDKFGEGNYVCRNRDCGPGGGFKLLGALKGWSFPQTLQAVEQCLGMPLPGVEPVKGFDLGGLVRQIWSEARPVQADEVSRYLGGRDLGFTTFPSALRCHARLGYFEKDANGKSRRVGTHPAMVARVEDRDGQMVALHRTYLQSGSKIPEIAKKVLRSGFCGASIRLFEPTDELALTEGIETALAVHLATGKPVWSALNASNLENVWLPPTVQRVWIYGDHDVHCRGQAAAYALACRLRQEDARRGGSQRAVRVEIPRRPGSDWADVWREMVARGATPPHQRVKAG